MSFVYFIRRTLAYFVDCLIAFAGVMLIFQWAILTNLRSIFGINDDWFQNSINMHIYVLFSISIPVWLYFSYYDSIYSKGTFGKRFFKLKVVNTKIQKISFRKSLSRTILKLLPWEIIHIGIIYPKPIYFEDQPSMRILVFVGILLFVSYIISIFVIPKKQSFYDLLLGTMVLSKKNK